MEKQLYSIFDKKAGVYAPPFAEANKGTAIRAIQDLVSRGDSTPAKYPEDYTLVQLASFNEETGEIKAEQGDITVLHLTELTEGK